jgi:hypothetical protein
MSNRFSLRLLIRYRAWVGLAGVAVIFLYLVFHAILRLGVISPLGSEASLKVLFRIINFTFILAITAVTLSIIAYTLTNLFPERFLAPLDAGETASLITRIVHLGFIFVITATIFGAVSYTLPRVLPPSFFDPVPKLDYALAIAKMFDPFDVDPMAKILDRIEIYPGFPYYSRESDHPTLWPVRVSSDRNALFLEYEDFLARYPVQEALAAASQGKEAADKIEILGGQNSDSDLAKAETILNLRSLFYNSLSSDPHALARYLGTEGATDFLRIEKTRQKLRQDFPNRFAIARIKNVGKRDAQNVTIEFDLFGELYDVAINADPGQIRNTQYDRAKNRIVIEQILPGSQVEIRLWYRYYSVKNRTFPDKRDFILELTQGIVINNVAVSEGITALNKKLMDGFSADELLYIGAAAKKDDYSNELAEYFKEQGKRLEEHMKNYDEEHPSFKDVSSKWLAASSRPDENVNAIWVRFDSKAGKAYKAIHVFHHPKGPYILLSSTDKDRDDFLRVEAALSNAYQGTVEGQISDRGDDICDTVSVANGFTQKGVAEQVDTFFGSAFNRVVIEAVYY